MDPTEELSVMMEVSTSLGRLDGDVDALRRVLKWICSRHLPPDDAMSTSESEHTSSAPATTTGTPLTPNGDVAPAPTGRMFHSLPDLYAAVSPDSNAERVLVVGYWFQVVLDESDLDGFKINRELRHLGHGIVNITTALSSLIDRRPQLVIQTRKSGNSKQARKRYRLTDAGIRVVQQMIFNLEA